MKYFEKYKSRIIMWLVVAGVVVFTYFYSGIGFENENTASTPVPTVSPTPLPVQEFLPAVEEPAEVVATPEVTAAPSPTAPANTLAPVSEPPSATPATTVTPVATATVKADPVPNFTEKAEQVNRMASQPAYPAAAVTEKAVKVAATPSPAPTESADDGKMYCTFSVSCAEILDNMNLLAEEKHFLIPSDGVIMPEQKVAFNEGETVFNVLRREMKNKKIHLEFVNTPLYKSTYIEGINNLYEFDCGEHSGWIYSVNGEFPNYGSSSYKLSDGDEVKWIYTCTFGRAVGGYYAVENE